MITFLQQDTTSIKICGLRCEEHIDIAVGAGVNAIGFMFVKSSPRFIERHDAEQLLLQLPDDVLGVAVLQNYETIADFSDWNGWIQLCGDEDEEYVVNAPRPVIRAFKWNKEEVLRWDTCPNVEALLVDGSTGGLGTTFDVTELAKMVPSLSKPVIIAGGLTPENVRGVIAQANPAAVDVSSGVESSKGVKDPQKICDFMNAARE